VQWRCRGWPFSGPFSQNTRRIGNLSGAQTECRAQTRTGQANCLSSGGGRGPASFRRVEARRQTSPRRHLAATSCGREDPLLQESGAVGNAVREVDPQDGDRGPADGRPPDEYGTAPAEMPGPLVTPRMEQPYDLLRHRVNAGKVGTLVAVVEEASQRQ